MMKSTIKISVIIIGLLLFAFNNFVNAQQVQTLVGNKGVKFGADALSVRLGTLKSTAIDAAGNIYYSDDYWIMKKDAVTGIVTKIAGTGISESNKDKISATGSCATCVPLYTTAFLSIDQKNNLLYLTTNDINLIKLDLNTNLIYSVAGGAIQYSGGNGDGGLAINAAIPGTQKIQTDSSGNIYFGQNFLDFRIRKINKATGIITTILGGNSNTPSLDGSLAINATITNNIFTVDRGGNVFYFDNNKIRKVDNQTGIISTIAGKSLPGKGGDGGLAIDASIAYPSLIHVDNQNNIYLYGDNSLRKINASDAKINTIAGTGINAEEAAGDGGLATLAKFNRPVSINTDNANNIYIIDEADFSIRKIDATTNIITRVIGAPTFAGDGGIGKNATLNEPGAIAMDKAGNIYIADVLNHRVRKQNKATGVITTVAGNGSLLNSVTLNSGVVNNAYITTNYDGKNATDVAITMPVAIAIDSSDNLFIAEQGLKVIFKVSLATGKINLFAGHNPTTSPANTSIGDGGNASNASFNRFSGLAIDNYNDIYISDFRNNVIRKVNSKTNIITTVVGSYSVPIQSGFGGDGGLATKATVYYPKGVCFDANNNLYFSDYQNEVLRKVDYATGVISTIAGMPNIYGFGGDGGSAKEASLLNPTGGMAVDKKNNLLYFSDNDNTRIRRINLKSNIISSIVGNGQAGYNGDTLSPLDTKLSIKISVNTEYLNGVAVDSVGDVIFSDNHNNLIRKLVDPMKVAIPASPDTLLPHKITIHRDKFVSLEMTQTEYNDWVRDDQFTNTNTRLKLLKEIYNRFKDNFDFLICNLNEPYVGPTQITYVGVNVPVSNKVKNIGRDYLDLADTYGASNGRLKSNIQIFGNAVTNSPLLHEIAHTYANFIIDSAGYFGNGLTNKSVRAHWGFTGGNSRGQLGGFIQSTLKENVDGQANKYSVASFGQLANGGNLVPYNEFELYTMGMIPMDSVKPFDAFRSIQSYTDSNFVATFTSNSRTTYNKAKIESTLGIRVPSATEAQKDFNALFIVITTKALTTAQIDQYDSEITNMTKKGDDNSVFYNFWEATKGLGTLNASGLSNLVATGTIERLDTNACASAFIRFKAYPLMNGGIRPKYQWYKNGLALDGENLNILSINNLANNDIVKCKISNSIDSVMAEHKLAFTNSVPSLIVKDTSYCFNASADTLRVTPSAGASILWYGTNATGGTATNTAIKPSTATIGTVNYYVSQILTATGCEGPRAKIVVTTKPIPAAPVLSRDTANNLLSGSPGTVWYKDGSIIADTVQKFKPTAAGAYTAKTSINGCTSVMSAGYYYLVTDIINLSKDEFIKLAPNPFVNQLNFDFLVKGYQKLNLEVYDLARGNKVASMQNVLPGMPIYLGQLSAGTYVIIVSSNDLKISYQFKMVKL